MLIKILIRFLYFLVNQIEKIEYQNLSLDEEDIDKKIINSFSNLNIKVLSDSGYLPATAIHLTQPYKVWNLELENGYKIDCADIHIFFDENLSEIYCKDLRVGQKIQTDQGAIKVKSINKQKSKLSMFDLSIDDPTHRYYTNGILSHNTINAAITMLHFITFNNDKNIMVVANIRGTTIEIVDKIKSIYVNLPFFLKVGIKNWSQQSLVCENGCRIKTAARSRTPAIGFTIDFLYLDEFAHIPSNIIEPYYTAAFPVVSAIENSKIVITSTPNGMNLFHRLLTDAERPDGDPLKNNYRAMRVYWHQVPGRFVTYIRLNPHRMYEFGVNKDDIFPQVKECFGDVTKVDMRFNTETLKDVIFVYNNDACTDESVRKFEFIDSKGDSFPIQNIAEVTTWKQEAIKDIGGEDAFNQEYGLRFVNATRSLLNENIIEGLLNNKKHYEYEEIYEFSKRLKFGYGDLKWIDDDSVFTPIMRNNIRGIMSVDISEGLGQDYSIINIFKIAPKPKDVVDIFKHTYTQMSDFFCLQQIGIYRSNLASVKQLAEIFYLLGFEYFNPEHWKVVLEVNNYGNEFLAHLPHVFDGNNDYGSSIFLRYKHRADAVEEKIGLKVGENKNMLVKEYQQAMEKKNFTITQEDNVREITTFVKHTTSAGNVRYAADIGNDDTVMTIVNASSVFSKHIFKEMVEDYAPQILDTATFAEYSQILKSVDFRESADYSSIINVNKQRKFMSQYKKNLDTNGSGNKWFGTS